MHHACIPIYIQVLLVQVGGVGDQVPSLIQVIAVVALLSMVPLMKYPVSQVAMLATASYKIIPLDRGLSVGQGAVGGVCVLSTQIYITTLQLCTFT